MLWTFNTIPRPGEFGNDTWENESWAVNGNTGVWTQITVDEDLGLVYLPVETPTSDFYGGHRPGNNLFGESLVCVDLKTGRGLATLEYLRDKRRTSLIIVGIPNPKLRDYAKTAVETLVKPVDPSYVARRARVYCGH